MRRVPMIAAIALGCGGSTPHPAPPAEASAFSAARWIPDKPTYAIAAKTVAVAQQGVRELFDVLGLPAGFEVSELSRAFQGLLGVDALAGDAVAAIGVDLKGGWAMFSEDLSPTFVVHLTAPDQMIAFLDRQREKGFATQSEIVDKIEISTAKIGIPISWAIDHDWMWVHFALPLGHDTGTAWFTASHSPHGSGWTRAWSWAHGIAGDAPIVGFFDLRAVLASISSRIPAAAACTRLFDPVGRAGLGLDTDGHHLGVKIAFDVGSTAGVSAMLVAPPAGWAQTAATAAATAEWNLDLFAARGWLKPCLQAIGTDLAELDALGVRTARGLIIAFDPDNKSGTGAVALDLTKSDFLASRLDDIPLRSTIERDRKFGPYQGHSVPIPFAFTIDYVLTAQLALAAVGDGLLARVIGGGAPSPATSIFAVDLEPPRMPLAGWQGLIELLDLPHAKRVAERLTRWHDIHLTLATEPTQLMLSLGATHR